jgi:glycosyltransferase involved in cell wall biosynthesis
LTDVDQRVDMVALARTSDPAVMTDPEVVVEVEPRHPGTDHHPPDVWGGRPGERGIAVAVLLPCRNEAATIGKVVADFRRSIPHARIYVYDNCSTDGTADDAVRAGAIVRHVRAPGKGNVVRQMFSEIDATYYIIADGDDTYDASSAPAMLRLLHDNALDMVVGRRVEPTHDNEAYRLGHRTGNRLLTGSVRRIFGGGPTDMLSGYRALSRRYVKSFPATSSGFETETEMTVHALEVQMVSDEVATPYRERPEDSVSKLRTIPDGLRILKFILLLCRDYRPFAFFGAWALAWAALGTVLLLVRPDDVSSWTPIAFEVCLCFALALSSLIAGMVLGSLGRSRRELKRMIYLSISPLGPSLGHRPEDLTAIARLR